MAPRAGRRRPARRQRSLRTHGTCLKWQALAALWVIGFSGIGTFLILKLVGLVVPPRMSEADMETGDFAVHGHEVYPSDIPSLAFPAGIPPQPVAAGEVAPSS